MIPLWLLYASVLVVSLLGGMGGRLWFEKRTRRELAEVWEEIESLSTRLSRREGKAGREVRAQNEKNPPLRDVLGLAQLLRGLGGAAAAQRDIAGSREEMEAEAARHFRRKDKNGVGE